MIRRGRERLGLTQARVAELIGRSPATVRSWEKGSALPAEASVVTSLAAVLDLDEATLFGAAGLQPPVAERSLTLEESLALIAPASREETASPLPDIGKIWQEPQPAAPAPAYQPPAPAPALEAALAGPAVVEPVPASVAAVPAATASVPVRDRRRRPAAAPTAPMAAPPRVIPPPSQPVRSYLEDSEQRLSYQLRGVYTLVGLAVLLAVLVWAAANALDALSQTWDALKGSL